MCFVIIIKVKSDNVIDCYLTRVRDWCSQKFGMRKFYRKVPNQVSSGKASTETLLDELTKHDKFSVE